MQMQTGTYPHKINKDYPFCLFLARSISEEFSSGEVKSHEDGLELKNSRESSKKKQTDEQDDGKTTSSIRLRYLGRKRRSLVQLGLHTTTYKHISRYAACT